MSDPRTGADALDLDLVDGFRFTCRPDCGLCCYAEPRVEPDEATRLLQIAPATSFRRHGRDRFLSSRPEGGACQFLVDGRCGVHAARPHPCREYPVTAHVGPRLQATVILSCPGIDLAPLRSGGVAGALRSTGGLAAEVASLVERVDAGTTARQAAAVRRGRKVERRLTEEGRWIDDDTVRAELGAAVPLPGADLFPPPEPPARDEGLERLPFFFDQRPGPVAVARALGGWELLELAPKGGARSLGVLVPPERPPRLDASARRLLEGYLRYVLARDAFLASVHLEMLEGRDGSVRDWVESALLELGAEVLGRASVRAKLAGRDARELTEGDIERGIRATDQDWLDRPTWGDRL